jgi:hypothetical protein
LRNLLPICFERQQGFATVLAGEAGLNSVLLLPKKDHVFAFLEAA